MNINLTVDGVTRQVSVRSVDRLVDIVREKFGVGSLAADCRSGNCGRCLLFMDGVLVYSCMVPAFRAKDSEIVTLDGFSRTEKYTDIAAGFLKAGVVTCGFCDSGKILAAADLLEREASPTRESILDQMDAVRCRCTDPEALVAGLRAASSIRSERMYRRAGK